MALSIYLCHACGFSLQERLTGKMLWCEQCRKLRRVPTDPRLVWKR